MLTGTVNTYYQRCINDGVHLWLGVMALGMAIYNPHIQLTQAFNHYMFAVDITQSMNVVDMQLNQQPISRLNFTLQLVKDTVQALPCGSKVSIALFANAEIVPLFIPLEVCQHFNEIDASLSHIEWRMAWRGSSHLRLALVEAARILSLLPEPAQLILLTDGDEAAPLNAITKIDLAPMQGSSGWLLAGIGGLQPAPVPKFNSQNQVIGYWSQYATKVEPSQIVSEDAVGKRDDSIATDPQEYYLSALREDYLKELASDIGARYIKAHAKESLLAALQQLPPAGRGAVAVPMGWLFAVLAGLCMLAEYLPRQRAKSAD